MIIVMNTLTAAVSEYDISTHALTPGHFGNKTGLYEFGGDSDDGAPIVGTVISGENLQGSSLKKRIEVVYFALNAPCRGELIVRANGSEYRYPTEDRASGVAKARPGRGIRENYIAVGFSNPEGHAFTLNRIEAEETKSMNRRV